MTRNNRGFVFHPILSQLGTRFSWFIEVDFICYSNNKCGNGHHGYRLDLFHFHILSFDFVIGSQRYDLYLDKNTYGEGFFRTKVNGVWFGR